MGVFFQRTPLEDTSTKVIFETKMLATMTLITSMAALVAGSALPWKSGECLAWSWSSATGYKCTQWAQELNTDPVDLDKFRSSLVSPYIWQHFPKKLKIHRQDSLAAHNSYRAKHGVAALKISAALNALAQEWAEQLIAEGKFYHRPNNNNGENIYMSGGMAAQELAQGAVDSWYSEIKDYKFGKEPSRGGPVTGHFTQVVWKGSTEVGVGVAQEGSKVVVVANYSPPGNFVGQYVDNVPAPQ